MDAQQTTTVLDQVGPARWRESVLPPGWWMVTTYAINDGTWTTAAETCEALAVRFGPDDLVEVMTARGRWHLLGDRVVEHRARPDEEHTVEIELMREADRDHWLEQCRPLVREYRQWRSEERAEADR